MSKQEMQSLPPLPEIGEDSRLVLGDLLTIMKHVVSWKSHTQKIKAAVADPEGALKAFAESQPGQLIGDLDSPNSGKFVSAEAYQLSTAFGLATLRAKAATLEYAQRTSALDTSLTNHFIGNQVVARVQGGLPPYTEILQYGHSGLVSIEQPDGVIGEVGSFDVDQGAFWLAGHQGSNNYNVKFALELPTNGEHLKARLAANPMQIDFLYPSSPLSMPAVEQLSA